MTLLDNLALGFSVAASPEGLFYCVIGVTLGMVVGVLPGLGVMATLAMLMPITYHIEPTFAIIMLAGIYYGADFGGSTASILLNLPGTAMSAVTALDGYPMARKGEAGLALFLKAIASFVGSMVGCLLLAVFSAPLAAMALQFGPQEYFALMLFGLVAASMLSSGSPLRSLAMVTLGLSLGVVGIDLNSGNARFTFGYPVLYDGLSLVAVAIGLFGVPELIANAGKTAETSTLNTRITMRSMMPTRAQWRRTIGPMARGTGIGSFFGALPGTGGVVATFMAYAVEKRVSRHPEEFGKGALEGVVAPESANNAAVQTAFIPTLSLGVPGDAVMAMMLGVLMVHGILPGPGMIGEAPELFWGLVVSFVIGSFVLLVMNIPLIGVWLKLLSVPYHILFPIIVAFICVGIYSVHFQVFDIFVLLAFGVLGTLMRRFGFDAAPLLLGLVLGPLLEEHFRRAMIVTGGDFTSFAERPISAVFLACTAALVLWTAGSTLRYKLRRLRRV